MIGCSPFSLSAAITASPTGPQPITSGTSPPLILAFCHRMDADRQRLGQRGVLGGEPVGHFQQQGSLSSMRSA